MNVAGNDVLWKRDRGGCVVDGEDPAVAGDVPRHFVVIGEKAELTIGGIGDDVSVAARRNVELGIAEVDAPAVELIPDAGSFERAVAFAGEQLKDDDVVVAEAIFVASGKVAINAVANLSAGGIDCDGFADKKGGNRLEGDIAVKIENVFGVVRNSNGARRQQQQQPTKSDEGQAETHEHPPAELPPC